MKGPDQNLDPPAVLVIASTRKAATEVNATIVHSAFNLPICKPGKQFCYRRP